MTSIHMAYPAARPPDLPAVLHTAAGWLTAHPALPVTIATALLAVVAARMVVRAAQQRRWRRDAHQLQILAPPDVEPGGVAQLWATLAGLLAPPPWRRWMVGIPHVVLEYTWHGRAMTIGLWIPAGVAPSAVQAAVHAAWPGATTRLQAAEPPLPAGAVAVGGSLAPALPATYPLAVDQPTDPLRPRIAAATGLHAGQHACLQVLARPATPGQHARLRAHARRLRSGRARRSLLSGLLDLLTPGPPPRPTTGRLHDPIADRDARAAADKAAEPAWEVMIRCAVAADNPRRRLTRTVRRGLRPATHALASAAAVYSGRNQLRRHRLHHPAATLAGRALRRGFLLSAGELAAVAGLPLDAAVAGLDRARAATVPAPVQVPPGGRNTKRLGVAAAGGHAVALPVAAARHHVHLLGATGSGKSTLQANMVLEDAHAGRGVVLIDPKGDLVADVLDRLPAAAADRVWLIDPDAERTPVLNPLEGDDDALVVDNVVSIFSRTFARFWGPRIDDVMRVACLTLLRKANATLTLIPPLLQDKTFRTAFTADLDDPEGLAGFWDWYESMNPALRAQVIGPVLARLRAFLLRDFARRTLGHPHSTLNVRQILDRGGILLVRLPKGVVGDDTCRLIGSFVLASVWQATTARAAIAEHRRRDAAVYLDEAHNFLTFGSVDDMLAEARGYRLSMVLAHQNLAQLPAETAAAISANARNKIYFACAPDDARHLARHTLPEIGDHDLANLPAYTAAARLVIDAHPTAAFTLRTAPPRPVVGAADHIRRTASQRLAPPESPAAIAQLARHSRARRQRPTGRP